MTDYLKRHLEHLSPPGAENSISPHLLSVSEMSHENSTRGGKSNKGGVMFYLGDDQVAGEEKHTPWTISDDTTMDTTPWNMGYKDSGIASESISCSFNDLQYLRKSHSDIGLKMISC